MTDKRSAPSSANTTARVRQPQEAKSNVSIEDLEAIAGPKGTESARLESAETQAEGSAQQLDQLPAAPEHPLDERDTAIPRPIVATTSPQDGDIFQEPEDLPPAPEQPLDERETAIPRPIVSVNGRDVEKPAEHQPKRSA